MRKIWFLLPLFVIASTLRGTERRVIAEMFTNWGCPYCGPADQVLDQITEDFPDLLVIRYHVWWPSGNDPMYHTNPQDNTARINYYGVNYVPHLFVDGNVDGQSNSAIWRNLIQNEMGVESPLLIDLEVDYDQFEREGEVITTITAEDTIDLGNLRIRYALTESDIYAPGPNGVTYHHQAMRDLFPTPQGIPISIQYGETVVDTQSFLVDTSWNDLNMELVVFVQSDDNHRILQANGVPVNRKPVILPHHYRIVEEDGNGNGVADPGETVNLFLTVENRGNSATHLMTGSLSALDPGYSVLTDNISFADLDVDEMDESEDAFKIKISADLETPDSGHFALHLEDTSGLLLEDTFLLLIGFPVGFEDNVDEGEDFWEHSGQYDLWHRTDHRSHSSPYSWYCGQEGYWLYWANMDAYLWSSYTVVPQDATFSFYQWYNTVEGEDICYVEMDFGFGFKEMESFSGQSNDWEEREIDLSDFVGSPLRVRFHFVSDQSIAREGWYIDDINLLPISVREKGKRPSASTPSFSLLSNILKEGSEIVLNLGQDSPISIKIFNAEGRMVKELVSGHLKKGRHAFDVGDLLKSPGIYFLRLQTPNWTRTERMIFLR